MFLQLMAVLKWWARLLLTIDLLTCQNLPNFSKLCTCALHVKDCMSVASVYVKLKTKLAV